MDNRTLLNMHKIKTSRFGNPDIRRQDESKRMRNERSARRTQTFNSRRNIEELDEGQEPVKNDSRPQVKKDSVTDRKMALRKYISEREAIKIAVKDKRKPPFKVGIPHHGSSPILREITNFNFQPKPMTASQEPERKFTFAAQKVMSAKKLTSPHTPTVLKRSTRKNLPLSPHVNKNKTKTRKAKLSTASTDSGGPLAAPLSQAEEEGLYNIEEQSLKVFEEPLQFTTEIPRSDNISNAGPPDAIEHSTLHIFPSTSQHRNKNKTKTRKAKLSTASTDSGGPLAASLSQAEEEGLYNTEEQSLNVFEEPLQFKTEIPRSDNISNAGPPDAIEHSTLHIFPSTSQHSEILCNAGPSSAREMSPVPVVTPNTPQHKPDEQQPKLDDESGNGVEEYFISPNVETKRGKWADRRRSSTSLPKPSPGHIRESVFQRERLDKETRELLALAEKWELIALQTDLPQDIVDEIDSVVGLTRLLTRDKFNQFRGLIEQFEYQTASPPVSSNDLNGFWDMIYLQVEPLVQKYNKLDVLKDSNWIQPDPPTIKKTQTSKTRTNRVPLRRCLSKRKEIKPDVGLAKIDANINTQSAETPVSASVPPRRRSHSISSSPYIAMRLSGVGRSLGQSPIVIADRSSTPKSILKKRIKISESAVPSNKTVLFQDTLSEEPTEHNAGINEVEEESRGACSLPLKIENNSPISENNEGLSHTEINHAEEKKRACSLLLLENNHLILENHSKSPRRSLRVVRKPPTKLLSTSSDTEQDNCGRHLQMSRRSPRLLGKSPTPTKCCFCSQTTHNNSDLKKKNPSKRSGRQSRRQVFSPVEASVQPQPLEKENKPLTSGKKFELKPSNLVFNEITIQNVIPNKTRNKKNVDVKESEKIFGETSEMKATNIDECKDQKKETSGNMRRRSSRKCSARQVTFDPSTEEKCSLKLPTTPFRKSGARKSSQSQDSPSLDGL